MLLYKGVATGVSALMGSANPINSRPHLPTDAVSQCFLLGFEQHGTHLSRCASSGLAANDRFGLGIG